MSQRSPYRTPASGLEPVPASAGRSPAPVCGAAWVAPIALIASGALLGGGLELGALAGFSGVLAFAQQWQRRRRARLVTDVWALLDCARVRVGEGTWASPCGSRRLRVEPVDDRLRFERVTPDGTTLQSYRLDVAPPAELLQAAGGVRVVREAVVHGRVLVPTCFMGAPGSDPRCADPARVRLVERAADVLVVRLDARGRSLGDTRHETLASARRQLRRELGAHLGRWCTVEARLAGVDRRDLATAPAHPSF